MKLPKLPRATALKIFPSKFYNVVASILIIGGLSVGVYAHQTSDAEPHQDVGKQTTIQTKAQTDLPEQSPAPEQQQVPQPSAAPTNAVASSTVSSTTPTNNTPQKKGTPLGPMPPAPGSPGAPQPAFEVIVSEGSMTVDSLGQIHFPFRVVYKNGYVGNRFNQPITNIISAPTAGGVSPTTMFGKEQPDTSTGLHGFVGFVVYDFAEAGDYVCQLIISDETHTATTTFVLRLSEE